MKAANRFFRDETGTAAIEFAFVGLVIIVVCIATVEFGRALHIVNELSYAADRGTRLVLLNPQIADTAVEAEVRAHLQFANTDGLEIHTSRNTVEAEMMRELRVSLPLTLLIPNNQLGTFRVSVERKIPSR